MARRPLPKQALVIKVLGQLREPSAAWGWGGTVPTPQGLGAWGKAKTAADHL